MQTALTAHETNRRLCGRCGVETSVRAPAQFVMAGFTLIELLVVIAIIAILAGLLMPSLSRAKLKTQGVACASNLKQLQLGWKMYVDDNADVMPLTLLDNGPTSFRGQPGSWVLGNSWVDANLTNLQAGTLFPYASGSELYHCPADRTKLYTPDYKEETKTPVNRSYSISNALNTKGGWTIDRYPRPYDNPQKLSGILLPGPSEVWVFIEKGHFSSGEPTFGFNISQDRDWGHGPTDRHSKACNLSYVDGHAAPIRWKAPKETRPFPSPGAIQPGGDRDDYNRLIAGLPHLR